MAESVLDITDDNFEKEVIQSEKPVLVDFWAPWCGPCKAIGPAVAELAEEFGGKVKFAKCNVDNSPIVPGKYGIRSIPTLLFIKDGNIENQIVGLVPKTKIEEMVKSLM
jgi:thioredoxin 1